MRRCASAESSPRSTRGAPEIHGLVALMELQASRTPARVTASGEPILLMHQNRSLWDQLLIRRGLAALARAESLDGPLGPYALQGCHRGLSRPGAHGGGDRLATNRRPLRCARRSTALAHRDLESRRRGIDGLWTRGGPGDRRFLAKRIAAARLPPFAQRAGRLTRAARAFGGGARWSSRMLRPLQTTRASAVSCCGARPTAPMKLGL